MRWGSSTFAGAAMLAVGLGASASLADPIADFYKGKQINWILSAGAGGGYAAYALTFAPHFSAHIPGNPHIVVQNMPGAGGIRAMLFLQSVAPKDGTTIGLVHSSVPFAPLYGIKGANFDSQKMNWIGSINAAAGICVSWAASGITTWQDLFDKEFIVGGTGAGSQMETMPAMLNKLFGTRIKVISGYKGGNDVYLAMERGEVHGRCGGLISFDQVDAPGLVSAEEGRGADPDRARARSGIPRCAGPDGARQGPAHQGRPAAHPGADGDGPSDPGAARHPRRTSWPRCARPFMKP